MSTGEDIERSYSAAGEEWQEKALFRVFEIACVKQEFTTDDVWNSGLELPPSGEPRAIGGVITRAKSMKIIKQSHCTECGQPKRTLTVREEANDRPVNVWTSLVYEGDAA